jgi:hypothetical protein
VKRERQCENCIAFAAPDEGRIGECRMQSPAVVPPTVDWSAQTMWPRVARTDWCLEFTPNRRHVDEANHVSE